MPVLLFVYGTLKEGFPNFHLNVGRRVPGDFRTRQPYRLLVVRLPNEDRAPWLLPATGHGHRVTGQVFEVDDDVLAEIDRFEEVGQPTGYVRVPLELERVGHEDTVSAFVYLKQDHQLAHCLAVEGPYEEYTADLATGYWITTA